MAEASLLFSKERVDKMKLIIKINSETQMTFTDSSR
jgi:hypothetical protein